MTVKRALGAILLIAATGVASAALPIAGKRGTVYEVQNSPNLLAQFAHAEQALAFLAERGWEVRDLRVRLTDNPYDATQRAADVVLPASLPLEDQFFLLVQGVVRKNLSASPLAGELADLVAASLAPPSSQLRRQWEASFQAALWAGDIERTALLELLWRTGKDEAVRAARSFEDVWRLVGVADDPDAVADALWDVALAALFAPQKLGWAVRPVTRFSPPALAGDAAYRLVVPQMRWTYVPPTGDGVAVLTSRLARASARLVVVYEDGRFDALRVCPGEEARVSFWGVEAVLLGVASLPGEAQASFAFRELRDYPVRLGAVDLVAEGESWQLSWEVERQEDVEAYVVEVLTVGEEGERVAERHLIPTAGTGPALLAWTSEARSESCQLRVYALTQGGVLARLFTSPLLEPLRQQ